MTLYDFLEGFCYDNYTNPEQLEGQTEKLMIKLNGEYMEWNSRTKQLSQPEESTDSIVKSWAIGARTEQGAIIAYPVITTA